VDDFARFEDLLQPPKVSFDLLRGLFAEELGDGGAKASSRRLVAKLDSNLRPSSAGRGGKCDRAAVRHFGVVT
jgi:hypothetical protein